MHDARPGPSQSRRIPLAWALENTAPAMLWPVGRSKTLHLPCSGHLGARRGCSSHYSAPHECSKEPLEPPLSALRALEGLLEPPAPRSVPPGRSKQLLKPAQGPRMLQVAVQASARYPMCAQNSNSNPSSVLQGPSSYLLGHCRSIGRSRMTFKEPLLGYTRAL